MLGFTVFVFIFSNKSYVVDKRACCVSSHQKRKVRIHVKMYKMLYRNKVESHHIKIVFAPLRNLFLIVLNLKSCGLILVFSRSHRAGACAAFSECCLALGLEASVDRARRDQRDSGGCHVTRPTAERETSPHVT